MDLGQREGEDGCCFQKARRLEVAALTKNLLGGGVMGHVTQLVGAVQNQTLNCGNQEQVGVRGL